MTTLPGGAGGSGYVVKATGEYRLAKLPSGELILQREYIRLVSGLNEWKNEPTVELTNDR